LGAGADLTFAAKEVEEKTLREQLNQNETVQKIIDKNQANNQDKALSRLERLEAELTLKLLDLKAKEGDFGVSAINSASIAYARRMIEKIDNLKELYIRLRKEKAQNRALIKPGSALNGIAAEIAKDVNDYIKEIEQAINSENNTLSQQQNSRASRMYQKLSTVSNSTSQGLFSLGGSLNNKNALNFSNTQQLLRNLSTLRGSLHLSNQFLNILNQAIKEFAFLLQVNLHTLMDILKFLLYIFLNTFHLLK
jgi:restriction endonuclease